MTDTITVPSGLNGPPDIAQGGYVCGLLAAELPGAVEVTLHRPTPLDQPLHLESAMQSVTLSRSPGEVLATAVPTSVSHECPPPVELEAARTASDNYPGRAGSAYPTCFVCGVEHPSSLGVFPGPVDGRDVLATPWAPRSEDAKLVWAVLDCPGGWAIGDFSEPDLLLGRMAAEIVAMPRLGEEHVLLGWELDRSGRKRVSGSALYTASGVPIAHARSTWISLRR